MSIYVVEIAGRGVVAFSAATSEEARLFVAKDEELRADLMVLESEGEPLWDGNAELYIRDAYPEEQARWQASQVRALMDGEIEDEDESWVLFLVPVIDPTDKKA
jgi:hypothetical protein